MRISNIQLEQIIREEITILCLEKYDEDLYLLAEGLITEKEFLKRLGRKAIPWVTAAAIGAGSLAAPKSAMGMDVPRPPVSAQMQADTSANMQAFLEKYPHAADETRRGLFSRLVQQKADQSKRHVSNAYLSNFESFERFIRSLEGYENQSSEDIKANWETYTNTASQALDSVPVVTYYDNIDQVPSDYITRDIPAFYDADQKKIFINPFFYFSGSGFNHGDFSEDLKEEYIHAVQSHIRNELQMPIAHMQTSAASKLNIFLPQEQTGVSQEAYDYLTTPQEFHAKMLKLKSNMGALTKDSLLRLMNSESPPEILKVLDPSKVDQVLEFFNMVAQGKTADSSEIA